MLLLVDHPQCTMWTVRSSTGECCSPTTGNRHNWKTAKSVLNVRGGLADRRPTGTTDAGSPPVALACRARRCAPSRTAVPALDPVPRDPRCRRCDRNHRRRAARAAARHAARARADGGGLGVGGEPGRGRGGRAVSPGLARRPPSSRAQPACLVRARPSGGASAPDVAVAAPQRRSNRAARPPHAARRSPPRRRRRPGRCAAGRTGGPGPTRGGARAGSRRPRPPSPPHRPSGGAAAPWRTR